MKNIKVNSLKAGFSLVEMLVVIAIIGIIAAIAIPNIGSINKSARYATAQRNAQSVASVLNAAAAAGVQLAATDIAGPAIVNLAEAGVSPTSGAFNGKNFGTGPIAAEEETAASVHLSYSAADNTVKYDSSVVPTQAQLDTVTAD